jgi:hypothetical protein
MNYSKNQFIALDTFLSYWPEDMGFNQIIDVLTNDEPNEIDFRGSFEDLWPEHIAELILDLFNTLLKTYGDI